MEKVLKVLELRSRNLRNHNIWQKKKKTEMMDKTENIL